MPDELITYELCETAFTKFSNYEEVVYYIPEELLNKEICKLAVENNSGVLKYVPEKYISEDLCKIAVQNSKYAIGYIPRDILTQEICSIAVENGTDLVHIPEEFRTFELFETAVEKWKTTEKNNELYQKLLMETNIHKAELISLFKDEKIFADKDGNAIFPTKDENQNIIGICKLNLNEKTGIVGNIEKFGYAQTEDKENSLVIRIKKNLFVEEQVQDNDLEQ